LDAALHRADLAAADLGHLLVGEAVHADQHEHLAVRGAQVAEGAAERGHLDHALLVGGGEPLALEVVVLDLGGDVLARDQAAEAVAQDREQPRPSGWCPG
jgi:hypothetical protein